VAVNFTPRAYQEAGTQFILQNPRCNLHVDMGLGKSVMVLNAIDSLLLCGETNPTLIVAPLRVARSTWSDEAAKWEHLAGLEISPVVGDSKQRLEALRKDTPVYTCNYENIPWLVQHFGSKWPFRTVVADESTKLKSHRSHFKSSSLGKNFLVCTGGGRAKALAQIAFKKVKRWVNLTGTPAPNSLLDLWGQQWFVDGGGSLGRSYSSFTDRWYKTGYNGYDLVMLPHAEKEVRDLIAPTTFTLRAEDYLNLGQEVTNTIFVDLPDKAAKHYAEMERELYTIIDAGGVEAFSAAAKSMKCHQLANGAMYHDLNGSWEEVHTAKIEALQGIVEEASGVPIIVVYKFKSDLERLKKAFPQGKALDTKKETEDNFKRGNISVLFVHPDSAGHGIDSFQYVTNIICFFSVDWNAETRAQVIARIGKVRQFQAGLNRPVFIHQIIARRTVDEDILTRIEGKMSIENALKEGLARRGLK
jgi:SNF2 family DNA or RNA helicase